MQWMGIIIGICAVLSLITTITLVGKYRGILKLRVEILRQLGVSHHAIGARHYFVASFGLVVCAAFCFALPGIFFVLFFS